MTITIELPDTPGIRERILPLSEAERNRAFADLVMRYIPLPVQVRNEVSEREDKLSQEDLDSIGRGIADSDAGRVRDADAFFTELYAERGWSQKK